jgi:competence protein ComEC
MAAYGIKFWEKAPFLRLLLGLMTGILLQWNLKLQPAFWISIFISGMVVFILFFFLPFFNKYKLKFFSGISVTLLFISTGALITWHKDIRNEKNWVGKFYKGHNPVIVTLVEPLVEKTKSYKADATVNYLINDKNVIPVQGKIILYFKKDSLADENSSWRKQLSYGSGILLTAPLQEIKNSGNPGGFDYKRYSLFHNITHQVFLKPGEFEQLNTKQVSRLKQFIFSAREKVLKILRTNITGRKELGLAEALLIGYKDDLDQALVQSYTNTGVVHIIAISGLHLGLIYFLLALLFKPLQKIRKLKWLRGTLVIAGLWLFALLAGAQPSVLRSALMFSLIVTGEMFTRKTSIYNTLAISAFILLLINPFLLWDVGFQLSYAAVISIVTFMRPVYNLFYIKNKLLDFIWKLNAVTIAAQVLTIPISIFHFHQFPTLFLLTNFLAVPLGSFILIGEIVLCILSFLPLLALLAGKVLSGLIWFMNTYIENVEQIPFSLWDGLQISTVQAILLLLFTSATAWWLLEKSKAVLAISMVCLFLFACIRSYSFISAGRQQKIIVYNVPQKQAIDFVSGRKYFFIGNSDLQTDGFARNFHLKPSRILYRIKPADQISLLVQNENLVCYRGKNILLVNTSITFFAEQKKPIVDLLIISGGPEVYMDQLARSLDIKQVVFDGSVPAWKTVFWKKDCDSLHIPWHDVTMQGAFEMRL